MTFTEVVFEVRDPRDPLCRAVDGDSATYALVRIVDPGRNSEPPRAVATFCSARAQIPAILRDLQESSHYEDLEVLSVSPEIATVRFSLRDAPTNGHGPLLPIKALRTAFGNDILLEPIVLRAGRARVRLVTPRTGDTQRALLGMRELQRSAAWPEFRSIRVASIDAHAYANSLRRVLTADQEDTLRLAVSLGYYETPKRATLDTIAKHMGLSVSPVHKRLKTIETLLVSAHVEPNLSEHPDFRKRPRKGTTTPKPAPLTDVVVALRHSGFPLHQALNRGPRGRAVFQHLHTDRARGEATALLVVLGPEEVTTRATQDLQANPDVRGIETLARESDHVALHVRTTLPEPHVRPTHPYAWFADAMQPDILVKPAFIDGPEIYARFLFLRPVSPEDILSRIDALGKRGGWDRHEILAIRPFGNHGHAPLAAPDRLTPRQEEVLKISYALGYYRTPRACTLETVASTLGVSANAIHKNLAAAELNVISSYLSSGF